MKKLILFSFISIITILLFNSCEKNLLPALGPENEIYVFADSLEYLQLESALKQVFEKEILTPQPEKLYEIKRVNYADLDRYKTSKNVIFVSPITSQNNIAKFITNSVDTTTLNQIKKNEASFIVKKDLWAKGQLVALISAPSIQEVEFEILRNNDKILYAFQKASDDRLLQTAYSSKYEKKDIEGKLFKEHNWIIYVQLDFELAVNDTLNNFVWIRGGRNTDIEKWIFVYWIDNATPEYLSLDSLISIRNRLTQKYYQTTDDKFYVEIADTNLTSNEINFNGRYALFTQGLWRMTDKTMGGPFVNYFFYDENSHRIYMLDGSLFAPRYYKRNLIQQIDVLLKTFMTGDQISDKRKKDLLKAVEN
ncbi:MAG: DUF4837 family protein [Ignavibacterium sp.]